MGYLFTSESFQRDIPTSCVTVYRIRFWTCSCPLNPKHELPAKPSRRQIVS